MDFTSGPKESFKLEQPPRFPISRHSLTACPLNAATAAWIDPRQSRVDAEPAVVIKQNDD